MNRLERKVEIVLSERIFFEAISLAYDMFSWYAIPRPPPRPTYVDFEAARMVGFAICYDRNRDELTYQAMGR